MYFAVGVLAYNLAQVLRRRVLPASYGTATVAIPLCGTGSSIDWRPAERDGAPRAPLGAAH